MVFVENDAFRTLRRLPTDAFRSIPRLPREQLPVAAADLVAWYPFREGTGADITAGDSDFGDSTDYSATVNGATYKPSGGVTDIETGPNSGAFEFDGTDDKLTGARGLGSSAGTILAQINISNANSDFGRVYSSFPVNGNGGCRIYVSDDDGLNTAVVGPSAGQPAIGTLSGLRGQFGQVGVRYDGKTIDAIKNGGVVASSATTANPVRNQAIIGHRPNGFASEHFGGIIDSVRVYDAALSDSQINQIYLNTKP